MEIKREIKLETSQCLVESGFSKIYSHMKNGAVALSACSDIYTKEENQLRTEQLRLDIISLGYAYAELVGGYLENDNTEVVEITFMIPYISKLDSFEEFIEKFHKLGNKYEQESILVMQPTGKIFLLNSDRNKDLSFGNIKFDGNNENPNYFSMLAKGNHRNKKWKFEGLAIPDTMFGKHSAFCKGKIVTG